MSEQTIQPEVEGIEVESASALATISKAEINMQISTARQYPRFWPPKGRDKGRGVEQFQAEVLTLATADEDTARSMFYHLERRGRGGKAVIEGPSIRMAEVVASCWRNLHTATRVVNIDEYFVTGQAVAWDLETNYKSCVEVKRRITDRDGRRYSEDMITSTANAAMSIALRNSVFKVVPGALIKRALDEAKKTSLGKGMTMDQRRDRAFKLMASVGADPKDVLRVLGRNSLADVTAEDLTNMNGTYTAIKEGDTTWAQILEDWEHSQPRTEEQIKTDMRSGLDDVQLAPDKTSDDGRVKVMPDGGKGETSDVESQASGSGSNGPAEEKCSADEVAMLEQLFDRKKIKANLRDRTAKVKEVYPPYTSLKELPRAYFDKVSEALESL